VARKKVPLGEHCSFPECHQLDFLPFKCKFCSQVFCLEHRTAQNHHCPSFVAEQNVLPNCPLCGELVELKSGEDVNAKVDAHIRSNCQAGKAMREARDSKRCASAGCRNPDRLDIVACGQCGARVCLRHRFPSDHACKGAAAAAAGGKERFPAGKQLLESLRQKREAAAAAADKRLGAGGPAAAAAKAPAAPGGEAALRLKVESQGGTEKTRHFYDVRLGAGVQAAPRGKAAVQAWIDRAWTVGRVLDAACAALGIANRNNEQGARRLVLRAANSLVALPMDVPLALLAPQVASGDTLVLEYEAS
jgi:predicted nucleic acid binding AN1-type Zn finger protein